MPLRAIPCMLMRGGTSRGPFFLAGDLPADSAERDRVLLAAVGSPDPRQIDGLGGATSLTSKVAIVSESERSDSDVDFLLAQVSIDAARIDTRPSCGNMLAGVGPFALERGLVSATGDVTRVRIYNVNTRTRIVATVQTPDGRAEYSGDTEISGVPGTASPIVLEFMDIVGTKTGELFPTGARLDRFDYVEATCLDVAVPMVVMRATDLGYDGYTSTAMSSADGRLRKRLEQIRCMAGKRMGLGDVSTAVIPKLSLISAPRDGGTLTSRYLTPNELHPAHAVTGGICLAACAALPGTIAAGIADYVVPPAACNEPTVRIEHLSGSLDIHLVLSGEGAAATVERAGVLRTARKIMDGEVFVP